VKSFLGELKRRNVVRVAILYAVVGWLVLQVADLVMPRLGIPAWGVPLVILLVVLGFPLALVLAWAFEVTPEGIKRTHEVEHHESITHLTGRKLDFLIIGVLAAALLYVIVDLFVLRERGVLAPKPPSPASNASVVSIAVLPFVDMSKAKDQEYLADGISEELLNVLARMEGFKVTGRTSAFAFKGQNEDLRTIGQKLGVENILEGSVRTQGERIRVTAQLVKASDGYHLWSDTYDRQLGDVFAIQDDIARQVVGAIRSALASNGSVSLSAAKSDRPPTGNVEAYTHFLRGQQLLRSRERTRMQSALAEYERAVALDPGFARAHVGIGTSLVLLAAYGYEDITDIEARASGEFERALTIEPGLPDAYAGQALLLDNQILDNAEQMPLLERAVTGNPSDSQSLVWLSQAYAVDGRAEDARRTMERAYAVDPLMPLVLVNYAQRSFRLGQRDLSERLLGELAGLDPESAALYRQRSVLAADDGRTDEAIRWGSAGARRHPDDAGICDGLALSWADLGDAERSLSYAARLRQLTPGSAFGVSTEIFVRLSLGKLNEAEELVESAAGRYDSDRWVQVVMASYLMTRGDHSRALQALLAVLPRLRESSPRISIGPTYANAAMAAYLFRETGDLAQSHRIAEAFTRGADVNWTPVKGQEMGLSVLSRARMAAVTGNRAAVIDNLQRYYALGGILPASTPREPWFQAYKDDQAVAELFTKADARREEARKELRAEGL
jgi:TolB-like protein/Tfp pilus assembly protein PilF